jgi:hypothetical protein
VNMSKAKYSMSPAPYASSDDFRSVFREEADSLYRLAFLLTADGEKAQQSFVSGLDGSRFSKTGHAHGPGGRSFKMPCAPSTHVQWRNVPPRVSTMVAQRRRWSRQRLRRCFNSSPSSALFTSYQLLNTTPLWIVRCSWAARGRT